MRSEKLEVRKDETPQEIGERAFAFAVRVVKLCQTLDARPGTPRTLSNQLLRSATSVGANLQESKGGQSRADFLSKVSIALKEARETHYWLRLLVAADTLGRGLFPHAPLSAAAVTAVLGAPLFIWIARKRYE